MSSDEKVMSKAEKFEKLSEAKSKQITRLERENAKLRDELDTIKKKLSSMEEHTQNLHDINREVIGERNGLEKALKIIHGKEPTIRYYDVPRTSEEDID